MFGWICKATERTVDIVKLAKSLAKIVDVKAAPLEYGKKHEAVGINRYMQDTGNAINPCGLVVSIDFPHIASSPDRKVTNDLTISYVHIQSNNMHPYYM
jgi:hypothetical protein